MGMGSSARDHRLRGAPAAEARGAPPADHEAVGAGGTGDGDEVRCPTCGQATIPFYDGRGRVDHRPAVTPEQLAELRRKAAAWDRWIDARSSPRGGPYARSLMAADAEIARRAGDASDEDRPR